MAVSDIKILIVDDESSLRDMLAILLQREGYQVHQAKNGVDALERISEGSFDLVITDMRMPVMGGLSCSSNFVSRSTRLRWLC